MGGPGGRDNGLILIDFKEKMKRRWDGNDRYNEKDYYPPKRRRYSPPPDRPELPKRDDYWEEERERNYRNKRSQVKEPFNLSEFMKKRKHERDEVNIQEIASRVFPPSPPRPQHPETEFIYDFLEKAKDSAEPQKKRRKELENVKDEDMAFRISQLPDHMVYKDDDDEDEETVIGPRRLKDFKKEINFRGKQLLPGEGEGMAKFVAEKRRIPKRGEYLNEDEIEKLESVGYVMSGSRNKRMTKVGKMKEKIVMTVHEKYQMEQEKFMERQKNETQVRSKLRKLIEDQKIKEKIY